MPLRTTPLVGVAMGRRLAPTAALVIGAVMPDVPLFLRLDDTYDLTHSLGGVLGVDVVLGTALVVLWALIGRDAWTDLAPDAIRDRLSAAAAYTTRDMWLTPLAVGLGTTVHVVLDELTHPLGLGSQHIVWLGEVHGGLPGTTWLLLAAGVVGSLTLALVVVRRLMRMPACRPTSHRVLPAWTALVAATLVLLSGLDTIILFSSVRPQVVMFEAANNVLASAVIVMVVGALGWHVRRTCSAPTRPGLA
jgi:hypothetical protein